jgi:hypothetical protein
MPINNVFKLLKRSAFILLSLLLVSISFPIFLFLTTDYADEKIQHYINTNFDRAIQLNYASSGGNLITRLSLNEVDIQISNHLKLTSSQIQIQYNILYLMIGKMKVHQVNIKNLTVAIKENNLQSKQKKSEFYLDSLHQRLLDMNLIETILDRSPIIDAQKITVTIDSFQLEQQDFILTDMLININRCEINKEEMSLNVAHISGFWPDKNLKLNQLAFHLAAQPKNISLSQFVLKTDSSSIRLSSLLTLRKEGILNLDIYEYGVHLAEFQRFNLPPMYQKLKANGELSFSGNHRRFNIQKAASVQMDGYKVDEFLLNASKNNDHWRVSQLHLKSNFGDLDLEGELFGAKSSNGSLTMNRFSVPRFILPNIDMQTTAKMKWGLEDFAFENAEGFLSFQLDRLRWRQEEITESQIDLQAQKGNIRFVEPSFIQFGQSKMNLEGTFNAKTMDVNLNAFEGQIAEIAQLTGITDSVKGALDGNIRIVGDLKDPSVSANLQLKKVDVKGFNLNKVDFTLFITRIFTSRQGEANLKIDSCSVSGIPLEDINIGVKIDSNQYAFPVLQLKSNENKIDAALNFALEENDYFIELPHLNLYYRDYFLKSDGAIIFSVEPEGIVLEQFRFLGPDDSMIDINGFYEYMNNDVQLYVDILKIKLDPFRQFIPDSIRVSGQLTGACELINPLTDPDIEIDLKAEDVEYDQTKLGNVSAMFQLADHIFYIQKVKVEDDSSFISFAGDIELGANPQEKDKISIKDSGQLNATLQWQNISLSKYFGLTKAPQKVRGKTDGQVRLSETVKNPKIDVELKCDYLNFDKFYADSLSLLAKYQNGFIYLDTAAAELNNTSFFLNGWYEYYVDLQNPDLNFKDNEFSLSFSSSDSTIDFIGLFSDQLESINGMYDLELMISGTPENFSIANGYFSLRNGNILLSRVLEPIEDVQFEASVRNSVLEIEKFSARSNQPPSYLQSLLGKAVAWINFGNDGKIEASGNVDFSIPTKPALNLNLELDNLYLDYYVANTKLLVSSNHLKIFGRDTIHIEGVLDVPGKRFEVDIDKIRQNNLLSTTTIDQSDRALDIYLQIELPGGFEIVSASGDFQNSFRFQIMGDIRAIQPAGTPNIQILGALEVISGTYSFLNQKFEVKSGTIDLTEVDGINPSLDIIAEKSIGDRIFQLSINGRLDRLEPRLKVLEGAKEIMMSETDKISLLTLGVDVGTLSGSADSTLQSAGKDVALNYIYSAVEQNVENLTGLDRVRISNENDGNNEDNDYGLGSTAISFGKYLTSNLYIEYKTRFQENVPAPKLSWDNGNRLKLQYRLNKYWSLNSFYEKTMQGNDKIKIGLNWEYTF